MAVRATGTPLPCTRQHHYSAACCTMVRCALQRFRNYSAGCVKNNDLARAAAKVAAGTSIAFAGYQFVYKQPIRRSMTLHAALKSVATEVAAEPAARRQTYITIRGLCKQFDRNALYQDFDLDIPQGKFTSIFG